MQECLVEQQLIGTMQNTNNTKRGYFIEKVGGLHYTIWEASEDTECCGGVPPATTDNTKRDNDLLPCFTLHPPGFKAHQKRKG